MTNFCRFVHTKKKVDEYMADFLEIRKKVDVIDYTELYYDN
jgi:hypothetical protein